MPILLLLGGCAVEVEGDGLEGLGSEIRRSILCGFDYRTRIEGDLGEVRAVVGCAAGADCTERRTVQRGATLQVLLEYPAMYSGSELHVEVSDPELLQLTGFDEPVQACSDGGGLEGTVRFRATGESALVVFADGREIDRFTATAHEPASLDIEVSETLSLSGGGSYDPVDALSFDQVRMLRALVRSDSGDRLIGGPGLRWSVDDADIASFTADGSTLEASVTRSVVWLAPVAVGRTMLHVVAGDLNASLALEVTAVPESAGETANDQAP